MEDSRAILFIDNGGYNIKALYFPRGINSAEHSPFKCCIIPNCVGAVSYAGRDIVGHQIYSLPHYHGLIVRRPVSNGFIVDGELQAHIWEYVLEYFNIESELEVHLWMTTPFAAPKPAASLLNVLLTQCFQFHSVTFVSSSFLALIAYDQEEIQCKRSRINTCNSNEKVYQKIPSKHVNSTNISVSGNAEEIGSKMLNNSKSKSLKKRQREESTKECINEEKNNNSELINELTNSYNAIVENQEKCLSEEEREEEEQEQEEKTFAINGCGILVDIGYSATTIIPYIDYLPVYSSIVRIDVGGKVLTNNLKELLSYTQINLLEDEWMVNVIKELCCYCANEPREALNYCADSEKIKNNKEIDYSVNRLEKNNNSSYHKSQTNHSTWTAEHVNENSNITKTASHEIVSEIRYYLPTSTPLQPLGCLGEDEASIRLEYKVDSQKTKHRSNDNNKEQEIQYVKLQQERFIIPELLFSPNEREISNVGIVQVICKQIFCRGLLKQLPLLQNKLLENICVYGGSASFANLKQRLQKEIWTYKELINRKQKVKTFERNVENMTIYPTLQTELIKECKEGNVNKNKQLANTVDKYSKFNINEILPMIGAWTLFTSEQTKHIREFIVTRSTIELQPSKATKVTDVIVHEKLLQIL